MSGIPTPPPPSILAEELALDPDTACRWLVAAWAAAQEEVDRLHLHVEDLQRQLDQHRAWIADLQGEAGL